MEYEYPPLPEPYMQKSEGFCCGNTTTGGEYMGQCESLCCGNYEERWPNCFTESQMREYAKPLLERIHALEGAILTIASVLKEDL